MPTSTIPYDPSLVLGMIIEPAKIQQLEAIAQAQAPVDGARDYLNALLRQQLSLRMTARELVSLGATPDQMGTFNDNLQQLAQDVIQAAIELGQAVIAAEKQIVAIKGKSSQAQISTQRQSPVDFAASQLVPMPISSDSMNMDVQYFRYEKNEQTAAQMANAISTFVGERVSSFLGSNFGASMAESANSSVSSAYNRHEIEGTLVICANCTSRQAQIFSPLVLDVDAAIDTYNQTVPDAKMPIEDPNQMKLVALTDQTTDPAKSLPILIGATYGSSFVGFVNFEQVEATASSQSAESAAFQARGESDEDLFLANIEGVWGMDAQSARSLKNLMSTSNVQSHCAVIAMGLIPSIKSNQVTTSIKMLQSDPKTDMEALATLQDATNASNVSVAAGAAAARKGQAMTQMRSDYIKAAVDAVAEVDNNTNQVIDLNSLQVALDNYVEKASDGNIGVPINFYVKYVTRRDIATAWMQKYYPAMLHDPAAANT
ncbi:MAG: hypothetical protein KGM17_12305 [Sphingomonadales bacterium]|nr:hypothetical protein [Sphingomonadales bacterium]